MPETINEIFELPSIKSLELAAALGDLQTVKALWPEGSPLDPKCTRALELAAANGQTNILLWAREHGFLREDAIPILARNAAINGRADVLAYLTTCGLLPIVESAWLSAASAAGEQDIVHLLRRLPQVLEAPLTTALFGPPAVPVLKPMPPEKCPEGLRPLIQAIDDGGVEALQALLARKTPSDKEVQLLFGRAAEIGALPALQYLQRRYNLRARNEDHAFVRAAEAGQTVVTRYFLINEFDRDRAKAVIDALPPSTARTELGFLVKSPDALRFGYLNAGADAIHAATVGDQDTIAFLNETGRLSADAARHAFARAAEYGHLGVVRYLHEHGVPIDPNDNPAFACALVNGRLEPAKYLFERGAKLEDPGPVLEAAYERGHDDIVAFFSNRGLDFISHHRREIDAMEAEIMSADPAYGPAEIWKMLGAANTKQLSYYGLHRFKRSVNQNYLQFTPNSLLDRQLWHLFRSWLRRPRMETLRFRMTPVSHTGDKSILLDRLEVRLNSVEYWRSLRYCTFVSLLWQFAKESDRLGLLDRIQEPRLGDPVRIVRDGQLLSQDLANSVLEANTILEFLQSRDNSPLRIAEIGAGYGRLAHVLLSATNCRYVVVDIPPTLLVSQWYLARVFPHKTIFPFRHFESFDAVKDEMLEADIVFLTTNQIALLPVGFVDACVNISSLHEMQLHQIERLMSEMGRIAVDRIYLKQYHVYDNPYDKIALTQADYEARCPHGWHIVNKRDCPSDPRFFEMVLGKDLPSAAGIVAARSAGGHEHYRPTVGILLCNYNHARYLPTALTAVAEQTRPADEIIIVDDGSTDDSISVIQSFEHRLPNLTLVRQPRNYGLQHAIATALKHSSCDYVVWTAADDLLLPEFLEKSMSRLELHPEAGLCFSQLAVFTDGTDAVYRYDGLNPPAPAFNYRSFPEYLTPHRLFRELKKTYVWISGNCVVANRRLLLRYGGFLPSLNWHSDWFGFYALALRHGACVIPETLALMREASTSYSRAGLRDKNAQRRTLEAILHAIASPRNADIRHFFVRRPTLLSVFGTPIMFVAWRTRHWSLAIALSRYYGGRLWHRLARQAASRRQVMSRLLRATADRARTVAARLSRPARRLGERVSRWSLLRRRPRS